MNYIILESLGRLLPVRPTTPTLLCGGIEIFSPFSTSGNPGRYRSFELMNSIRPSAGQFDGRSSSSGVNLGASLGILKYCVMRSTAYINHQPTSLLNRHRSSSLVPYNIKIKRDISIILNQSHTHCNVYKTFSSPSWIFSTCSSSPV